MSYSIQPGDIAQVVFQFTQVNVVTMLNVLHYRYAELSQDINGPGVLDDLLAAVSNDGDPNNWVTHWKELGSNIVQIDKVHAQLVYGTRYAKRTLETAISGSVAAQPLPGANQFSVMKRGDLAARHAVGGIRVGGIAETMEAGSELTVAAQAHADLIATALKTQVVTPGAKVWKPIVYRRSQPGNSVLVTNATANYRISTQRSRVPFRGI